MQVLKLQESPESIPQGEMPRHLTVYCERTLCERVSPGARLTVLGIYSIKKIAKIGVSLSSKIHLSNIFFLSHKDRVEGKELV